MTATLKTAGLLKPLATLVIASLLLIAPSCDEEDRFVLRFSHSLHTDDEGMDCSDCHGEWSDAGFALPGHDICVDCHDDIVEAEEIAEDTCGVCHVEKDLGTIGEAPAPEKATRGVFRHGEELADACADCHGKMLQDGVDHVDLPSRSDVLAIREAAHASGRSCGACHATLRQDVAPSNHHENWKRRHGLSASREQGLCGMCHMEESCRGCHQEEQPLSHTNLWRLRTHGFKASWGREACQTCHQEDFCVACHRDTSPRSHSAGWGRRHCFQCHTSQGAGNGCEICHVVEIEVHDDLVPTDHPFDIEEVEPGTWCSSAECHPGLWTRHPFSDEGECVACHRW